MIRDLRCYRITIPFGFNIHFVGIDRLLPSNASIDETKHTHRTSNVLAKSYTWQWLSNFPMAFDCWALHWNENNPHRLGVSCLLWIRTRASYDSPRMAWLTPNIFTFVVTTVNATHSLNNSCMCVSKNKSSSDVWEHDAWQPMATNAKPVRQ